MSDPRPPHTDQDDPLESEGEDAFGDGPADTGADSPASATAPGSLMSLRIRKRAAKRPQAPQSGRLDVIGRLGAMQTSASAGAISEPAGSEPAQPRPAAPAQDRPAPDAGASAAQADRAQGADLVTYWTHLKSGRRYPRATDLDHGRITSTWPNSILMRCRPGSKALQPDRVFSTGDGAGGGLSRLRASGRINLSPMMLQWLLGLAEEVVQSGRPMQDEEEFPASSRSARYRAVALPFSNDDNSVDHVLCHVAPAN